MTYYQNIKSHTLNIYNFCITKSGKKVQLYWRRKKGQINHLLLLRAKGKKSKQKKQNLEPKTSRKQIPNRRMV